MLDDPVVQSLLQCYSPDMRPIVCPVRDIAADERRVREHVIGQTLQANQEVIIQVVTLEDPPREERQKATRGGETKLPEWCNVYDGLTPAQIADVEKAILQRSDLSRPSA